MLTYEMLNHRTFEEMDLDKDSFIPKSKFGELGLGTYLHIVENISFYGMGGYDTDEIELILVRNPEGVYHQFLSGKIKEIKSDGYYGTKKEGLDKLLKIIKENEN